MKIHTSIVASVEMTSDYFDTEDMGFTDEEWLKLSREDKKYYLQKMVDEDNYIVPIVTCFVEIKN